MCLNESNSEEDIVLLVVEIVEALVVVDVVSMVVTGLSLMAAITDPITAPIRKTSDQ